MKKFEKFLEGSVGLQRLVNTYLELRQYFQSQGWSEKDVEKIPYLTADLIRLSEDFRYEQKILFRQLKDIGFVNVTEQEYNNYIQQIMQKINDITPLSDGNSKRRDKRDKDY